ncbi:MAG TPA: hypothetical protein VFU23_08695, partial [Gemmatimonadales bacterium]|nr:hypothetical protein [Gemmatimonadales bacterium]
NRLPGSITTPRHRIAWSPDGKGYAYISSNQPNPGVTVLVNGKAMGPTYSNANELKWNADGTRFAYLGVSPNGFFEVIDGQEIESLNDVPEFQWSPDGKRYAFMGKTVTVVDGKELAKTRGQRILESFVWSADSRHFAYTNQTYGSGAEPVVDGEMKPFFTEVFQQTTQALPKIGFPPMVFSPDGAHLAYLGRTFDATRRANSRAGVVIDGVRNEGPGESYMYPSWSPDSKHFGVMAGNGRGWGAMIDGKMGAVYEAILQNNGAACHFVDGHSFRFFGIRDGQIYRVTFDIG